MAVYYLQLFVFFLMTIFVKSKKNKISENTKKNIFIFCVFFVLFYVSAFRSLSVGTDTIHYAYGILRNQENAFNFKWMIEQKAPVYSLLVYPISKVLPSLQCYQIVSSLIIEGGFAIFIYKCSKDYIISTWLFLMQYFYFQSMNISRQFMAVAFVAIGVWLFINNKKKLSILLFVLSLFIHSTSIMALPILLLGNKNKKIRIFITIFISTAILLYPYLIKIFVSIFPKYAIYDDSILFETGKNRKIILTIFQLGVLLFSIYIYKLNEHKMNYIEKREYQIIIHMTAIGVVIGFAALNSILITRLEYYYSISFMLLVPITIEYSQKNKNMLRFVIPLIMAVPGLVLLHGGIGGIVPYSFY